MEVTEQSLRENFSRKETYELIELRYRGGLTDLALGVLEAELKWRGVSDENQTQIESEIQTGQTFDENLASLGHRLGAQIVDSVVALGLLYIFFSISNIEILSWIGITAFLGYLLFSDALPNGQSLGKKLFAIAVIDRETNKPCSLVKSLLRNFALMGLGIFDWVFIFGEKRQRLGDMIANTYVINTSTKAPI